MPFVESNRRELLVCSTARLPAGTCARSQEGGGCHCEPKRVALLCCGCLLACLLAPLCSPRWVHLPTYLPTHQPTYLPTHLPIYLPIHPPPGLPACPRHRHRLVHTNRVAYQGRCYSRHCARAFACVPPSMVSSIATAASISASASVSTSATTSTSASLPATPPSALVSPAARRELFDARADSAPS